MRNILLVFVSVLFAANLSAQSFSAADQKKIGNARAKYSLDEKQTNDYKKIIARYNDNLLDIQTFETADPEKYQQKMMALIQGNETSMKRLLNGEQLKIYQKEKLEKRRERAAFVTQLKNDGKTKEEMKKALIEWQITQ